MDYFKQIMSTQTILFIYLIAGIVCRKSGICSDEFRTKLTDFLLHITLPCMIFESFHMDFSVDILWNSGIALLIASVVAGFSILLGQLLFRRFPAERRCVMQYGTLCNNSVFTGFPLVNGLFGNSGLLLASFYVIPNRILMWVVGISYFSGKKERGLSQVLHTLRLPAVAAVYIGLFRMVSGITLPVSFDTAISGIGACTSPLAMILVGSILADNDIRHIFDKGAFYLVLIRQIVIPLLSLGGLRLFPVDSLTVGVSVVISGMPIATTTAILAQRYGADTRFASGCVFLSTLTSLVTVPLLTFLLPQ